MVASPVTPPWRQKDEVKDEGEDDMRTSPLSPETVASPCTPPDACLQVTPAMLQSLDMRAEDEAARAGGVRWQDRGPPGPDALPEGQTTWRGQRWRAGGQGGQARWGNCGGRNKEWWTAFYAAKHAGKMKAFLEANPKPK